MDKTRILYVDDSHLLLSAISSLLSRHGYEIVIESDPAKGIDLANNDDFDIILCDYDMPHINGDQFYDRISSKNKKKFVLFSGSSHKSPSGMSIQKGIDSFLLIQELKEMHKTIDRECSGVGCGKHVAHCKGCGKGATEIEYLAGGWVNCNGSYCRDCQTPEIRKNGFAAND
jgi:CheY-like chemotaxis protein